MPIARLFSHSSQVPIVTDHFEQPRPGFPEASAIQPDEGPANLDRESVTKRGSAAQEPVDDPVSHAEIVVKGCKGESWE